MSLLTLSFPAYREETGIQEGTDSEGCWVDSGPDLTLGTGDAGIKDTFCVLRKPVMPRGDESELITLSDSPTSENEEEFLRGDREEAVPGEEAAQAWHGGLVRSVRTWKAASCMGVGDLQQKLPCPVPAGPRAVMHRSEVGRRLRPKELCGPPRRRELTPCPQRHTTQIPWNAAL